MREQVNLSREFMFSREWEDEGSRTQYGAIQFSFNPDEESQRSKWSSCLDTGYAKGIYYAFTGVYAGFVSILFMGFAIRRATTPFQTVRDAAASFSMNAPMAWLFTDLVKDTVKRLYHKREPLLIAASLMAFALSAGTTGAGLQIARESVSKFTWLPLPAVIALTVLSAFNTFSTRFVGSIFLLHGVMVFARNSVNSHRDKYAAYHSLLDDLKRYGGHDRMKDFNVTVKPGVSPEELLERYATQFYPEMTQNGLLPGVTWTHSAISAVKLGLMLAVFSVFIVNMQPLWLRLTVEGLSGIGISFFKGMSESAVAVWYAATSNELFYISSGIKFFPSLLALGAMTWSKTKAVLTEKNSSFKKTLMVVSVLVGYPAWLLAAYYSGAGFAVDAQKAMTDGFGAIADNTYFKLPLLGAWTTLLFPYYDLLVGGAAGVIINGGATLRFIMDSIIPLIQFIQPKLPFFKPDEKPLENTFGHKDAIALLQDAVDNGDYAMLDSLKIKDIISQKQVHSTPSLWQSAKRCIRYEEDPWKRSLYSV